MMCTMLQKKDKNTRDRIAREITLSKILRKTADLFNQFFRAHCLVGHFFMPSQEQIERQRKSGKVINRHDHALSTYRRLMRDPRINQAVQAQLDNTFHLLDLAKLFQEDISDKK